MDRANRYDGIEDYAAWLIRHKAWQLVGCTGLSKADIEDIEQELILDLLERLPKYDSDKAGRKTFIARIVEHKIANIIEERSADKRDWRLCRDSLNDRFETGEGESTELFEVYDEEEYLRETGQLVRTADDRLSLSIDLSRAIASLPPELRELCNQLQEKSMAEISRDIGIPRGTLYDRLKELRHLFEDRGLRDYL